MPTFFAAVLRNMGLNPKYDTTTNLYTVHECRARLYETLARPDQAGGILLFDIDDFSRINGSHDCAFGNQVLRAFAEKLQKATGLPVFFWDERLSSSAMENFLIKEVDMSRSKRRKVLDSSAAAYILQGALDALRFV